MPIGTREPPVAIVLATADAAESDRDLATWQRRLLAGCLGTAACAVAAGYVLARRVTRPIDELRAAAARLAGGEGRKSRSSISNSCHLVIIGVDISLSSFTINRITGPFVLERL